MPDMEKAVQEAVDFALLQQQVNKLEKELSEATTALESLKEDRNKALLWGIMVLGTAVLSMGTWIFQRILEKLTPVM